MSEDATNYQVKPKNPIPQDITVEQNVEENEVNNEFSSPKLRIAYKLIDNDIIGFEVQEYGNSLPTIDFQKAKDILEAEVGNDPVLTEIRPKKQLENEAKLAFDIVIQDFLQEGVLTQKMLENLNRLIDVDGIVVVETPASRFLYTDNKFVKYPLFRHIV